MSLQNPTEKDCFRLCVSCYRCADKGRYAACSTCSGRNDPQRKMAPEDYRDDRCDCANGILRWRTREGRLIIAKIPGDPYAGKVRGETQTADERDYNAYLRNMRERTGNEHWDPVRFEGGASTNEWFDRYKRGLV